MNRLKINLRNVAKSFLLSLCIFIILTLVIPMKYSYTATMPYSSNCVGLCPAQPANKTTIEVQQIKTKPLSELLYDNGKFPKLVDPWSTIRIEIYVSIIAWLISYETIKYLARAK